MLNDDEINQAVIHQEDEENDDKKGNDKGKLSHAAGRAALELATTYIEQQTEATKVDMMG